MCKIDYERQENPELCNTRQFQFYFRWRLSKCSRQLLAEEKHHNCLKVVYLLHIQQVDICFLGVTTVMGSLVLVYLKQFTLCLSSSRPSMVFPLVSSVQGAIIVLLSPSLVHCSAGEGTSKLALISP